MDRREAHWSEWVSTVLGMLWLGLFPFWQDGSYSRMTHSKWVGMIVLTGVTAVVCGRMVATLAGRRELRRIRITWVHGAALAYFLLVGLSAIFGTWADFLNDSGQLTVLWGARRFEGLYTQLCYAAIFLCMSLVPVRIGPLLNVAGDALAVFAGVIVLQYAGINVLELFPVGRTILTNHEFQGTIGNIDVVCSYLSLVTPALLAGFTVRRMGGWGWLVAGMAGVMLMLCTEVQSGYIALLLMLLLLGMMALRDPECRVRAVLVLAGTLMLVSARLLLGLPWLDGADQLTFPYAFVWWKLLPALAGLVLCAVAWGLSRRPGPALSHGMVAVVVALVAVAALLFVWFVPIPGGNGLWELQEVLHGRPKDAYGSERIGVWRLTLEMSRDSLLFGTGPDTFLYAMDNHIQQTGQRLAQNFDNPHSILLGILSNNGLPAMLAFILLCGGALVRGWLHMKDDRMVFVLLTAVLCYLVQGLFVFSICLVTPMFYAALGMLSACGCRRKEDIVI